MSKYHTPVLLHESLEGLNIQDGGIYVDVTFGGGGHSKEILNRLNTGHLYAFDQDPDAAENEINDERFTLVRQNFKYIKNFLKLYRAIPVNGILADLGVSSHQFDTADRGFSTRFEGPLDMRMNTESKLSAKKVINEYPEEQLSKMFYQYGEIKNARRLAADIVIARSENPIENTTELNAICTKLVKPNRTAQYLAQVFQAIRIEVNQELEALKALLEQSLDLLAPGGRLSIISYHSLEDRLVKNYFKTGNFEGKADKDFYGNLIRPFKPINNKIITANDVELKSNPRSRSAKLRIAERI